MSDIKIQIIGDRFEVMRYPLQWRGITIENIISNCNPIAMVGHKDEEIAVRSESINSIPMQLMAKGNLAQMLSHREEDFEDNSKYADYGQKVRYRNESKYIVVCNDLCSYGLYLYRGSVYSDTYPENKLLDRIVEDRGSTPLPLPYTSFDWESLYDAFIDAILGEYDSEHIILIRTNVMRWHQDAGGFVAFDESARNLRNQIEKMDVRFAARTGCHCVDAMYAHIPNNAPYAFDIFPYLGTKSTPYSLEYAARTSPMYKELEYALDEIINGKSEKYRCPACPYSSPLVRKLSRLLSKDVLARNQAELSRMEDNAAESVSDLGDTSDFAESLRRLSRFIEGGQHYSLSDYIAECMETSLSADGIRLLELAVEYFKLGLDEIISIYQISLSCGDKKLFRNIVSKICSNNDCYPLQNTRGLIRRNLDRLSGYPYVERKLLLADPEGNYIRLDNGDLLVLDADADEPLRLLHTEVKTPKDLDYARVIKNDYTCAISEADALCCDWAFYIARAREEKGNHPVTIRFDSPEEFALSLAYVDYTDLLESEYFVLAHEQSLDAFSIESFRARTDLSFLFEADTRIQYLSGGLADQLKRYFFSKCIEEKSGGTTYYDDVAQNGLGGLCEPTYQQIISENIEKRCLSKLLSPKLISRIKYRSIADRLYLHGLSELFGMMNYKSGFSLSNACPHIYIPDVWSERYLQVEKYGIPYSFGIFPFHVSAKIGGLAKKYIQFPPLLADDPNIEVMISMAVCDPIVIHVRRGDFVAIGRAADASFYRGAMKKLKKIPDYLEKKFFIFSDDIPWCKENLSELGFDIFPNADIVFVDFNRDENSFRDMQLMSYGKVMVGSTSGFFLTAAVLAENCEIFMCSNKRIETVFERDVRKNKYVV